MDTREEIEILERYISNAEEGFSYIAVEDLAKVMECIVVLKEENRKIRNAHYHESIIATLLNNHCGKNDNQI